MNIEQQLETIIRRVIREEIHSKGAEPGECLRVADAAKFANVSISTIEKWGRQGLRIMKRGSIRRVDAAELRAFLQAQEPEERLDVKDLAKQIINNVSPMRRAK